MRCTNCGCENPDYAVVCEQCGAFLPRVDLTRTVKDAGNTEPTVTTKDESIPNTSETLDNSILDLLGEKKIICSHCWTKNKSTDTVCAQCGMPLEYVPYPEQEGEYRDVPKRKQPVVPEVANPVARPVPEGMIRCRKCWADNPQTAVLCESCGSELRSAHSRTGVDEAYETLKKKKNERIVCVNCGAPVPWSSICCDCCGKHPRVVQYEYDEEGNCINAIPFKDIAHLFESIVPSHTPRVNSAYRVNLAPEKYRRWVNATTDRKVRCAKCLELNEPGSTECRFCGSKITLEALAQSEGRKICTCGYKNLPGVTVCLMCGGVIRNEEAAEETAEETAEKTE